MSSPDMSGGFSESGLLALQRKFGVDVTPRAKPPATSHGLTSTAGCPCSSCRFTAVCIDGCDRFNAWVAVGTYPPRSAYRRKRT